MRFLDKVQTGYSPFLNKTQLLLLYMFHWHDRFVIHYWAALQGNAQLKNGGRLVCAAKRQNGGQIFIQDLENTPAGRRGLNFNTQTLADRKSNRQSLSLDQHLCFLLSCFHKQTSAFMSIPPPLSAGDFWSVLSSSVKSLPLLLNRSLHAGKNLWYPGYIPRHSSQYM